MTITDDDLREGIAIAKAATPGPWDTGRGYEQDDPGNYVYSKNRGLIIFASIHDPNASDCAFVAANSPDVAIALREELLAARAEIARLSRWLANAQHELGVCDQDENGDCDKRCEDLT